jgi:hypothetical protein
MNAHNSRPPDAGAHSSHAMILLPQSNQQSLVPINFSLRTNDVRSHIDAFQCKIKLPAPAASERPVGEELLPSRIDLPALAFRREGTGQITALLPDKDESLENEI